MIGGRLVQACVALVLALASAGCALTGAPACPDDPGWQTLAEGIHVWQPAPDQEVAPGNGGHVAPTSVLVAGRQAWVIDPGPSLRQGQQLRHTIACRWGAEVVGVFNTHAHAENVLGNEVFCADQRAGRVRIMASAGTAEAMARRCPACLEGLRQRAGTAALLGTDIVLPDRVLRPDEVLRLGEHPLRVLVMPHAHTESDLVLWHEAQRIAWVGGLVYGHRVPELAQGSLLGWRVALTQLRGLQARWLVGATVSGGDGAGLPPAALLTTDAYLSALQARVLRTMEQGLAAGDADALALPAFAGWTGYAERHGFNVQRAWRELEPGWMDGRLSAEPSLPDIGR